MGVISRKKIISQASSGVNSATTAALALKQSLIGFYNVKDYGAIGNGTTNDTTAIQAAVTASIAATGNANIIFPNGRYKVNSIITIDISTANVNILGYNSELVSGISSVGSAVLKISSASKVFIDGLSIDFNSNAVVHYGLIVGDNANNKYVGVARIENCDFYNFGVINQRGILLENTPFISGVAGNFNLPSATISNCNFYNKNLLGAAVNYTTNILYGIAIQFGEQTDYARVINCNFNYISIGVYSTAGANMDITGCNFLGCLPKQSSTYVFGCVYIPNTGTNNGKINIVACKFNHNLGYSIYYSYATAERPLTVSGCHFISNGTTAIYMTHTATVQSRAMIHNNYFERCSQAFTNSWTGQPFGATLQPFIYMNNQLRCSIKLNTFLNDGTYGIVSANSADYIIVKGNNWFNITGISSLVGVNNQVADNDNL